MEIINTIILVLAAVTGSLLLLMSILFFIRLRWPAAAWWGLKIFTSALSRFLAAAAILVIVAGIATGSVFISLIGIYDLLVYSLHIYLVTRPPKVSDNFKEIFGDWEKRGDPGQKKYSIPARTVFKLPVGPKPEMVQNLPFATIPGTERKLLCDIWLPNQDVPRSGLAFIFLHGSAFYFLDKDCGTRPFFTYLASQGHVIMDVAYRLAPETDIMGMVHDVKRAVDWMKTNSREYRVDPGSIVVGGGSAGGHLALLAAYTVNDSRFLPFDLTGKDLNVRAVVAIYPSTDLEVLYYHTNQHRTTRSFAGHPKKKVPTKMPGWIKKRLGADFHRLGLDKGFENAGTMPPLIGGHPDECPEKYAFLSPLNYVHSHCPPTLLIHGDHDVMAPAKSTRFLFDRLKAKKVPVVLQILPQSEHAFDMALPKTSPAVHNTIYDIDRFLALFVPGKTTTVPVEAVIEKKVKTGIGIAELMEETVH